MVDQTEKALKKLKKKERVAVKSILTKIQKGEAEGLDMKKLKSHDDIFRVRKGKIRIIFRKNEESILILSIERRSDRTYGNL